MQYINLFVSTILLVSLAHTAFGINCFVCSSYKNPECATLMKNDTNSSLYVKCDKPEHTFCRKTIITIIDNDRYVRVNRECGTNQYKGVTDNCYEIDDEFKFEKNCQCFQDGCNSSSMLHFSMLIVCGALFVHWLNQKQNN